MPVPAVEKHHQSILIDLVLILRAQCFDKGELKVVNESMLLPTLPSLGISRTDFLKRHHERYMLYGCDVEPRYPGSLQDYREFVKFIRSRRVSLGPLKDNGDFHAHFFQEHGRQPFSDEFRTYNFLATKCSFTSKLAADAIAQFLLYGKVPMIS